jgi:DNA-binding SARP family transcriptional activator
MISQKPVCVPVQITFLGPFSISSGSQAVRSWPRPPVKRLYELVFVSPGRGVLRDVACEQLFPNLNPPKANVALTRALSLARTALSDLGEGAPRMLQSDRNYVSADPGLVEETDFGSTHGRCTAPWMPDAATRATSCSTWP